MIRHRCLAVTPPGVEEVTAAELTALGIGVRRSFRGGVEFSGTERQLYAANLWLRTATRVVVRVTRFTAATFTDFEAELAAVAWERWTAPGTTPTVRVTSTASRLYHTDAVAERVVAAAGSGPEPGGLVIVRLVHDRVTVSVDSSGAPLHQRGWRLDGAGAPLRDTLAAAMLLASGWDGAAPLLDPLCGSGTIAIEAALLAAGRPPAAGRRFAFQDWPTFAPGTWASVTATIPDASARVGDEAVVGDPSVLIVAADRDRTAIAAARANASRAGVADAVTFSARSLSSADAPGDTPGWIVTNPPYGKRVGRDPRALYAQLGEVARQRFAGWAVALLVADAGAARATALPLRPRLHTVNGGIPVHLLVGRVPVRSAHAHGHRHRAGDRRPPA
jgi:putative N6-adenine-specific DNA methylase